MNDGVRELLNILLKNKSNILDLLLDVESIDTANHEFQLAIDCLSNISLEEEHLSIGKVKEISVFLPLNLPLYSLIIFCVIPGLMSESTSFRCPKALEPLYGKLFSIPGLISSIPTVRQTKLSRKNFIEGVASISDVVIFTGKYENAVEVRKSCPTSLFIYNGASVNHILIGENADVDLAVKKSIEARIFNSGQDCAGPDAIIIPEKVKQLFLEKLTIAVSKLKVGNYHDAEVKVGPLISEDSLGYIKEIFTKHIPNIHIGGTLDEVNNIVYPTIIVEKLSENPNYEEFFCPVFYVSTYSSTGELNSYFDNPLYKDYAMYISVFGDLPENVVIPNTVILKNQILLDIEKGNEEYGGYGYKANFVANGRTTEAKPVLISREIAEWIKLNKKENI